MIVGAGVYTVSKVADKKVDQTSVMEHELEVQRLLEQAYKDANRIMHGVYYDKSNPGQPLCGWYRNRQTPPNSEQFTALLETVWENQFATRLAEYSAENFVDVTTGPISIKISELYNITNDSIQVQVDNLLAVSDPDSPVQYQKDLSGEYVIQTQLGNFYEAMINWMVEGAGDVANKISEDMEDEQCHYKYCHCYEWSKDWLTDLAENTRGEPDVTDLKIKVKEKIVEAIEEMEQDQVVCKVQDLDINKEDVQIRINTAYGYCTPPQGNIGIVPVIGTKAEVGLATEEVLEGDCTEPLPRLKDTIADTIEPGLLGGEQPEFWRENEAGGLTAYYDIGFDSEYSVKFKVRCYNDIIEVLIPFRLRYKSECLLPTPPPDGNKECAPPSSEGGHCQPGTQEGDLCGITNCEKMTCNANGLCVSTGMPATGNDLAAYPDALDCVGPGEAPLCQSWICEGSGENIATCTGLTSDNGDDRCSSSTCIERVCGLEDGQPACVETTGVNVNTMCRGSNGCDAHCEGAICVYDEGSCTKYDACGGAYNGECSIITGRCDANVPGGFCCEGSLHTSGYCCNDIWQSSQCSGGINPD